MVVETTIRGEIFTHKLLWECCLVQIETANKRKTQTQYFYLSAMLMAYLTYEAYINFLGDRFSPDIWKKEKEFFSKNAYQGLSGKLKYLAEIIPIKGIKKGQRPMQTINRLKKLRDFLSHGKMDKYEITIEHHRGKEPPLFGPYGKIDKLVTPQLAAMAVSDVKEFIEFLHAQARKHTKDIWFGDDPLDELRAHAWSESKSKA